MRSGSNSAGAPRFWTSIKVAEVLGPIPPSKGASRVPRSLPAEAVRKARLETKGPSPLPRDVRRADEGPGDESRRSAPAGRHHLHRRHRRLVLLSGPYPVDLLDRQHEDLAVA